MKWEKQLMAPMTYGHLPEKNWEQAFGKRKDGMNEETPPVEDVYERKLREYWKKHEPDKAS